ncbi:MAG: DegQ family serine endoprotease [Gammaproteobacteria bacterium]|nr:DegQ family serine endoprotease [Gammaproteobacteria bacterium]
MLNFNFPTRFFRVIFAASFIVMLAGAFFTSPAHAQHAAANLGKVEINRGFADLVEAVKPAVVNISTTSIGAAPRFPGGNMPPEMEEFFRRFFDDSQRRAPRQRKTTAVGSGFIVDASGLVVTNHHVIDGADEIEVVFDDGARFPATLRGRDKKTDLALLQISAGKPLPFVRFGDSDAARVGDWVIAIGNPFGLGGTTTSGIISARGRDIRSGPLDDFIQIDAPINRGNSGGPLFNTRGEVIGVNSAIYSPTGGSVGIGFAIPSALASDVVAQLREDGVVRRGFLGVYYQPVGEEIAESLGLEKPAGALVTQVISDSPAEKAGMEAGDVILEYDGSDVGKARDLPKLVARTKEQSEVEIVVWREERRRTLRVIIGRSEDEEPAPSIGAAPEAGQLGLSLGALTAEAREKYGIEEDAEGVLVRRAAPGGAAARLGLREGEVIVRIGSQPVKSPKEANDAIREAREAGKKSVLLRIMNEKRFRFVALPLEE